MKLAWRLVALSGAILISIYGITGCKSTQMDSSDQNTGFTTGTMKESKSATNTKGSIQVTNTTAGRSSDTTFKTESSTVKTEPSAPPEKIIKISQDPVMTKSVKADKLICHSSNSMTKDEKIMMAVLQGYVAQSSSTQIYFSDSHYATYLKYLKDNYDVSFTASSDIWNTIGQFKSLLKGYILYDGTGSESTNVANSLGGLLGCLVVTPSLESKAKSLGLTMKLDVRGKNLQWLFDNYWKSLSHKIVVEIDPKNSYELRDYAALSKAFVIYGNTALHDKLLKAMDKHARAIGYGDYSKGEQEFVNNYSDNGVYLIADGLSSNLSVFCGYHLQETQPQKNAGGIKADSSKHYVAFQVSDGDNVQVVLNAMYTSPKLWKQPDRKSMKVSWGIPPALIDLAPFSLKYYYDNAGMNSFACSASGMGYFYPSRMPLDELKYQAATLNYYLERTGMRLVQILDHNSYFDGYLWETYTKQPNCDGIIYENYGFNKSIDGLVRFSNGKPVVAPRFTLWEAGSKATAEENSYIKYLKESSVKDPTIAAGYTLIFVNLWAEGLNSVSRIIKSLPSNVEVVTPDEMFHLMKDNIKPTEWDFRKGTNNWKISGKAAWGSGSGIVFRGDGGFSDGQVKASASYNFRIPNSSEYMIFNFHAPDAQAGGCYRIRIKDGNNETVIANWTRFTRSYQGVYANVKKLAGKSITVTVDYDNGMSGKSEALILEKVELVGR